MVAMTHAGYVAAGWGIGDLVLQRAVEPSFFEFRVHREQPRGGDHRVVKKHPPLRQSLVEGSAAQFHRTRLPQTCAERVGRG